MLKLNKSQYNQFRTPTHSRREFCWLGLYNDGSHLSEFDFKYRKENSFYSINQKKLLTFGMIGHGYYFHYTPHNGIFYLNDKKIQVSYRVGDEEYRLSNAPNTTYNQKIIQWKDVQSFWNPFSKETSGDLKPEIYMYNFGYKQKLEYSNGTTIYFQPIVHIPLNEPIYMTIRLVSNRNLNGELVISDRSKPKLIEKAPLKAKVAGEMNWVVR